VASSRALRNLAYALIWVAAFALSYLASHLEWWQRTGVQPLVLVLAALPAAGLALMVHELGHLAAGLSVGFLFLSLTWGKLVLCRVGDRLHLRWLRGADLLGGLCVCVPPDTRRLRSRYVVFIAGGPAASLLLAGAAGLALFTGAVGPGFPATVALTLLAASLVVFVSGLVPYRRQGVPSDAARLVQVLRGGAEAERFCALGLLGNLARTALRPRDWSPELVARALGRPDGSHDHALACLYAHIRAKDRDEPETAGRHLDAAGEDFAVRPRGFRISFALCAAVFEALERRNVATARAWLDGIDPASVPERHDLLLAEAAVLLAEGRRLEAGARAEAGLAALPRNSALGVHRMDEEGLRAVAALAGGQPVR
jgi:hypothetical protein